MFAIWSLVLTRAQEHIIWLYMAWLRASSGWSLKRKVSHRVCVPTDNFLRDVLAGFQSCANFNFFPRYIALFSLSRDKIYLAAINVHIERVRPVIPNKGHIHVHSTSPSRVEIMWDPIRIAGMLYYYFIGSWENDIREIFFIQFFVSFLGGDFNQNLQMTGTNDMLRRFSQFGHDFRIVRRRQCKNGHKVLVLRLLCKRKRQYDAIDEDGTIGGHWMRHEVFIHGIGPRWFNKYRRRTEIFQTNRQLDARCGVFSERHGRER